MNFDTAIYYDIENLIGGYGTSPDALKPLSLKKILGDIKTMELVGTVAIQRAYANWSDPRLQYMRKEMIELGIEPVQMIGFGLGPNKNASDLHLAIDAIECALTRGFVQRFVIVSGDGGFACLAKKLHEYNRVVIGCAYKESSNQVFKGLCDEFLWLDGPAPTKKEKTTAKAPAAQKAVPLDAKAAAAKKTAPAKKAAKPAVKTPEAKKTGLPVAQAANLQLQDASQKAEVSFEEEDMLSTARRVFGKFINLPAVAKALNEKGLTLSTISQEIYREIPDFSVKECGFGQFKNLLNHLVHGTKVKHMFKAPHEHVLVLKSRSLEGYEEVASVPNPPSLHSEEVYRSTLSRGAPLLILPPTGTLQKILTGLEEHRLNHSSMSKEECLRKMSIASGTLEIHNRGALFMLLHAGFLYNDPNLGTPEEPYLILSGEPPEEKFEKIVQVAKLKIQKDLGHCEETMLRRMFGEFPTQSNVEASSSFVG